MRTCLVGPSSIRLTRSNPSLVAGETGSDLIKQAAIDLKDDLQMTRQHDLEPCERPFLKRFGQKCVIGVRQGLLREVPGLVPTEVCFVEQNPHQLRDRHRRVRIVELDGDFIGKRAPVGVGLPEAAHEIGQRAGNEKIFLHKAQALTHARVSRRDTGRG